MRIKFHPSFAVYLIGIALLSSIDVVLSILLTLIMHEACHYIACSLMKEQIEQVEITPFGGVMIYKRGSYPHKGMKGVFVHAAGPIGNYLLLLCVSLPSIQQGVPSQILHALITSNISMLLLNLFPALPLDGGRIVLCLGYYFFPAAKLIRLLTMMGICIGFAGIVLTVYGLLVYQTLNCSLLIVSIYMMISASQSQRTLLAENIYAVVHERLSESPKVQRIEQYRVAPNTPLYELIPYLKEGCGVSFYFSENNQDLQLTEYAFCRALCARTCISVKDAYHLFTLYGEKEKKNDENTSFPS